MRIYSATFYLHVLPFRLDLFQPRTQPQKLRQTPKETTNQHGRRHIPPRIHCYISVYWYLAWNTFYSLQKTFDIKSFSIIFVLVPWQLLRLNRRQPSQCSSPPSPQLLGESSVTPKPRPWAQQVFGKWLDKNDPEPLRYLYFEWLICHRSQPNQT